MKAAVINSYGDASKLSILSSMEEPVPSSNQVKIKVKAAGVNPLDWRIRNGELRLFVPGRFPLVLGNDAAGIVTDVGSDVSDFKVGDRVFCLLDANEKPSLRGFAKPGAYAEYAVTRADTLAMIPKNTSFVDVAAIPLAALTAYQTLVNIADVKHGQTVLINGAAGGVGSFAVQIANLLGAQVTAIASQKNQELVRSLGAQNFIDYRAIQYRQVSGPFDVVYDVVSNQSYATSKHLLAEQGMYISNVATGSTIFAAFLNKCFSNFGITIRNYHAWVRSAGEDLAVIADWLAKDEIRSVIDEVIPIGDVQRAHQIIEGGHVRGKLVLDLES